MFKSFSHRLQLLIIVYTVIALLVLFAVFSINSFLRKNTESRFNNNVQWEQIVQNDGIQFWTPKYALGEVGGAAWSPRVSLSESKFSCHPSENSYESREEKNIQGTVYCVYKESDSAMGNKKGYAFEYTKALFNGGTLKISFNYILQNDCSANYYGDEPLSQSQIDQCEKFKKDLLDGADNLADEMLQTVQLPE